VYYIEDSGHVIQKNNNSNAKLHLKRVVRVFNVILSSSQTYSLSLFRFLEFSRFVIVYLKAKSVIALFLLCVLSPVFLYLC